MLVKKGRHHVMPSLKTFNVIDVLFYPSKAFAPETISRISVVIAS